MSPIPIGARVHHCGCLWNYDFTEDERRKEPSWGWGTVLEAIEQPNGSFEYFIQKDAEHSKGLGLNGYWTSYHIDRWEILT